MSTPTERKEIYGTTRWRRLRDYKLDVNPLCEECERNGLTVAADLVHHVKPISEGGDPFPEIDGLESLCTPCHSSHHSAKELTEQQKQFYKLLDSMD